VTKEQEVARRWNEAFNAHDEDGIRALYHDRAIFEAPGDVRLEGADAIVEYAMSWLRAFPDAKMRIETEIAKDQWVVQRFEFKGTHGDTLVGPTGEIAATNRRITGRGVEIIRVEGGKITEDYLYFDQVDVLTQLGLMGELAAHR
jgi:steroid delta-isomerase-like uncharacterized protein